MQDECETIIIGAGITSISCARLLVQAGQRVRLIDKGRGIGGRMATKRVALGAQEIRFDHGAQYLRPRDPVFRQALLDAGAVDWTDPSGGERLVGAPGISALPRALAQGLDITQQTEVSGLSWQGAHWLLSSAAGAVLAQRVILCVPAPQALRLLGTQDALAQDLAQVRMAPCLTLMAAFPPDSPAPFAYRRDPTHPLAWIARDDSKPGRNTSAATWVAQAGAAFSETYLEDTPDQIAARMLALLCDALGAAPDQALHVKAHRWRYAQATNPLGRPFLHDRTRNLYLGGDWCLGPHAEHGWQSGQAIARDILQAANKA